MNKQIFCRLTKYDEKSHIAVGVITSEAVDKSNEALDYEGSKKYFEEWSQGFVKVTDGQSVGNLRVMHTMTVAGKLVGLEFDDAAKVIRTSAEVVDENEQKKCAKGCYTGFSIGGDYVSKTDHPTLPGVKKYVAKPTEVSLVDNPCNPDATFVYTKVDGSTEMRKYVAPEHPPLTAADVEAAFAENPELQKAVREALAKVAARSDTSAKEGEDKYGNVKFADETNKKYPIDTAAHIRAAWNYINKGKNAAKYSSGDVSSIKSKIVAAWKDKIDPAGPPSAAKKDVPAGEVAKQARIDCVASVLVESAAADAKIAAQLQKLAAFTGTQLEKGFWTVSRLAELLCSLQGMVCDTEYEAATEGDNSTVPAQLREAAANLCHILLAMAEEECEEAFDHDNYEDDEDDEEGETLEAAAKSVLQKRAGDKDKTAGEALQAMTKRATEAEGKLPTLQKDVDTAKARVMELEKLCKDSESLMEKATKRINDLSIVVNKLKAEPQPVKAARGSLTATKADDQAASVGSAPTAQVFHKADGSVDEVRTAMADALSKPEYVRPGIPGP